MKSLHKPYDDDGRTVADMSGIERQPLFVPARREKSPCKPPENMEGEANNTPADLFAGAERRAYIGGALAATLLVASVFILAAFLLIFLITKIG